MSDPRWFILLTVWGFGIKACHAANILGMFTSSSPSHLIVHMSVIRGLVENGHNVTVVSTLPLKRGNSGVNHIYIPPTPQQETDLADKINEMASSKSVISKIQNTFSVVDLMVDMQHHIILDPRFQSFLNNSKTAFDLVIIGYFVNEFQLGVAAHFKCPVIVSWSGTPMSLVNSLVGNPAEISYVPNHYIVAEDYPFMGFLTRTKNFLASIYSEIVNSFFDYKVEKIYSGLFPYPHYPSYQQMRRNVSLLLCNSHFSEGLIRPNVPAVIETGGIQVKDKPDPLPEDIKDWLESASNDGAILFSLGSNIKMSELSSIVIGDIFRALSSLKQKVIWKYENTSGLLNTATNILFKSWLPQDDILAHPNVKLFITHGGKGGIAEAQHHAVPMVVIPMFADQFGNANQIKSAGFGEVIDFNTLTMESFQKVVLQVLSNPQYARKIQDFSRLYLDRPLTAKQTATFWIEYVLRHRGAAHMQSPLVYLNFWQNFNLDVIALLLGIAFAFCRTMKAILTILKVLSKKISTSRTQKQKTT